MIINRSFLKKVKNCKKEHEGGRIDEKQPHIRRFQPSTSPPSLSFLSWFLFININEYRDGYEYKTVELSAGFNQINEFHFSGGRSGGALGINIYQI